MTQRYAKDPVNDSSPDLCFPISARLLTSADFKAVFDQATVKSGSRNFLLLSRKNGEDCARVGLVVAKKRARRAVDRNRVKRVARESFRLRRAQMPALDIVVLLRGNLHDPAPNTLRSELDELWDKLLAKWNQA